MWPFAKKAPIAPLPVDPTPDTTGRAPRGAVILVSLGGAVLAAWGLYSMSSFIAPVLLAVVVTMCVNPLRVLLESRGVPRGVATASVVIAVLVLTAILITIVVFAIAQFAALIPEYSDELADIGSTVADWLTAIGFGTVQVDEIFASLNPRSILDAITGIFGSVASISFSIAIVGTSLILLAMDASYLPVIFRSLSRTRPHVVEGIHVFARAVQRYMIATAGLGVLQGILNAVILAALGVPGSALWGVLSFLCSFIPNIGYWIAIIPPLFFGFLTGGWPTVIWVAIVYGLINGFINSVIQPAVVGNAVALNQILTFVSVLFWGLVLGPVGAVLAVPLTLFVRMLLVDSDPGSRIWAPAIGDLDAARAELRSERAARKATNNARQPTNGGDAGN